MPIPYPSSPTVGQTFTYGGITYTWNGVAWVYTKTKTPAVVGSVAVTAPITNTGTPTAPVIGINQSALVLAQSQVTNLVSSLAGKANLAGGNTFTDAQVIGTNGTANIGLVVIGTASQSADLIQIRNSAGTNLVTVNNLGSVLWGSGSGSFLSGTNGRIFLQSSDPAVVSMTVRGANLQSTDLQQWQNNAGGTVAAIDSTGQVMAYNGIRSNSVVNTTTFNNSRIQISNTGTIIDTGIFTNPALRVQNTNSTATANLTEWLSSTGGTVAYVASTGFLNINNASLRVNTAGATYGARIQTSTDGTAVIGIVVRGVASQSANLQEWQDSAAGTVAYMGSGGAFRAAVLQTTSAAIDARLRNAGGEITFTRATAAAPNPGANLARIYVRDGTLAGTLRFVSITGASGLEETLIDNISSTSAVASSRFVGAGGVNTAGSIISSAGLAVSGTTAPILLNGSAGTTGQVLTSAGPGASPTWNTVSGGSFTGGTLTSNLTLVANGTATSPLTFQSGTVLNTATAGAREYDGTVFYETSNATTGRALDVQEYYWTAPTTGVALDFSATTTGKSIINGGAKGLVLVAGTTYEFELYMTVTHTFVLGSSQAGTFGLNFTTVSGTPTNSPIYQYDFASNTTGFNNAMTLTTLASQSTGTHTFSAAITVGSRFSVIRAKGIIRVTGTGTTRFYPYVSVNNTNADNGWVIGNGSFLKIKPVGNGTVSEVGSAWS